MERAGEAARRRSRERRRRGSSTSSLSSVNEGTSSTEAHRRRRENHKRRKKEEDDKKVKDQQGSKVHIQLGVKDQQGSEVTAEVQIDDERSKKEEDDKKVKDQQGSKVHVTTHVQLGVRDQQGSEVQFRIKKSTPLRKLMDAYCIRLGLQSSQVRFFVDGAFRIGREDSAEKLGLEDMGWIEAERHEEPRNKWSRLGVAQSPPASSSCRAPEPEGRPAHGKCGNPMCTVPLMATRYISEPFCCGKCRDWWSDQCTLRADQYTVFNKQNARSCASNLQIARYHMASTAFLRICLIQTIYTSDSLKYKLSSTVACAKCVFACSLLIEPLSTFLWYTGTEQLTYVLLPFFCGCISGVYDSQNRNHSVKIQ